MSEADVRALFDNHRGQLVNDQDFTLFKRLAEDAMASGDPRAMLTQLDDLLGMTVQAIGQQLSGEEAEIAIGKAIDSYVLDVWAYRRRAGLGQGNAGRLAETKQVVRRLVAPVRRAIQEDWTTPTSLQITPVYGNDFGKGAGVPVPAAAPAQGDGGGADKEDTRQQPKAHPERRRTDNVVAPVKLAAILKAAKSAYDEKRYVIALLGMTTAGKTFLVRRMADQAEGYGVNDLNGTAVNFGEITGRTKGVVGYLLDYKNKARSNLTIFDLPGEYFTTFAAIKPATSGDEEKAQMAAVLAVADICIMVEPAMQVFAEEAYIESGDCTTQGELADFLKAWDEKPEDQRPKDITREDWAAREALNFRVSEISNLKRIPDAMIPVRHRMLTLRNSVRELIHARQFDEAEAAIKTYLAKAYSDIPKSLEPLPFPGLLLLSRTDDFIRRTGKSALCQDPLLALRRQDPKKFAQYSASFAMFAADFISANIPPDDREDNLKHYDKGWGHQGVDGLIEDWIVPAIALTRKGVSSDKRIMRPLTGRTWAHRARWLFDPEFRKRAGK